MASRKDIDGLADDPALLKALLKRIAMECDIAVEAAIILGKGRAVHAAVRIEGMTAWAASSA